MQQLSDAFSHVARERRAVLLIVAVITIAAVACRGGGSNPSESDQGLPFIQPTTAQSNCVNAVQPDDAPHFEDIDFERFQQSPDVEGLSFYDIEVGTGDTPTLVDAVSVEYAGWLEDGCMFDTSFVNPEPANFLVVNILDGWRAAMATMQEGGKRVIMVEPELAYRAVGFPPRIPPNATLLFHIELINRLTRDEAQATVEAEIAEATAEAERVAETATAEAEEPSETPEASVTAESGVVPEVETTAESETSDETGSTPVP